MAKASAVPAKTGVVTAVRLSTDDVPESLAAARSGRPGAAGAVVSIVIVSGLDADEVFGPTVANTVGVLTPVTVLVVRLVKALVRVLVTVLVLLLLVTVMTWGPGLSWPVVKFQFRLPVTVPILTPLS